MLSNRLLQEKTFENLIQEARMQIPLYSKEWTNLNPSDPAITIMEDITGLSIIQQAYIDRMPESVQERLFAMAGFARNSVKGARVLVEAKNVKEPVCIPAGQKFMVGDMSFETNRENVLHGERILGLYCRQGEEIRDFSYVLDPDIPLKATIFSENPQKGMELYIVSDKLGEPGDEVLFYLDMEEDGMRNEIQGTQPFAEIQWQCYTKKGFVNLKYQDHTEAMLVSGELRFRLPKEKVEIYDELPERGYVIRGILQKAEYDIYPRLTGVYGFLFEMWQKDTKAICYTFKKQNSIEIYSDILEDNYWQIFCREEKDGCYHKYEYGEGNNLAGRYYNVERLGFGRYRFYFDTEQDGYGPGDFSNAIKLVAYNEEIMPQYDLGQIYGYDNQKIELPLKQMVREGFSVIAQRITDEGEEIYDFVKPDSIKEEEFNYHLLEADGVIEIEDAADFIGAKLYLCGCTQTNGEAGNLRAGSVFHPVGYDSDIIFQNPAPGKGGRLLETLEQVRRRFVRDVNDHYTAVQAKDYEKIVKTTPGLCIHKVKAVAHPEKNQVQIAVKPYSTEPFPKMSAIYKDVIKQRLEQRRLLTTRIELMQPAYVQVDVQGIIYVKPHFENSIQEIEEVIRKELDYLNSDRNFGERFNFDELFHHIEALECVDFIYELSAASQNYQLAPKQGMDIQPMPHCLLYPGEISLELNTME